MVPNNLSHGCQFIRFVEFRVCLVAPLWILPRPALFESTPSRLPLETASFNVSDRVLDNRAYA